MAYTPTNWQTGDVVTAEKLNKLENALAGGGTSPLIVRVLEDTRETDKTTREIKTAFESGITVLFIVEDNYNGDYYSTWSVLKQFETSRIAGETEPNGSYTASFESNQLISSNLNESMHYAD